MSNNFLKAEWRKLAIANFAIEDNILDDYLPNGTEIDHWQNTCYVSLVGFLFKETSVKGFKIPFHINFEEVNLRFYVRYNDKGTWKRGVVFIKEIVPKPALTFIANYIYGEHYETMPMKHSWILNNDQLKVEYQWKKNQWNLFSVVADKNAVPIKKNSEEEFITEHYWGYTKISAEKTSEYEVEHPKWEVYPVQNYTIDVDFKKIYGEKFSFLKTLKPKSVFLAEGSEIKVNNGTLIN